MAQASVNICYFAFRSPPSAANIEKIASAGERFIIFDSSVAVSEFHVMAALKEAEAVFSKNRKYRRVGTIFLMYLTGNDQIETAIKKAGITTGTRTFMSILLGDQKCVDVMQLMPENVSLTDRCIPHDAPEKDRKIFDAMTMVSLKL